MTKRLTTCDDVPLNIIIKSATAGLLFPYMNYDTNISCSYHNWSDDDSHSATFIRQNKKDKSHRNDAWRMDALFMMEFHHQCHDDIIVALQYHPEAEVTNISKLQTLGCSTQHKTTNLS